MLVAHRIGAVADQVPDLAAAVTELYAVFSRYPLREPMGYCPHCVAPEEAAELIMTPLREIPAGLMGRSAIANTMSIIVLGRIANSFSIG